MVLYVVIVCFNVMNNTSKFKMNSIIKLLNYVATSDSDDFYLNEKQKPLAKMLRLFYILIIISAVILSFLPLFFSIQKQNEIARSYWFLLINISLFVVFVTDYILRWITYPVRVGSRSVNPLFFFPFTGVSFIMIFSLLPTFFAVFSSRLDNENPFVKIILIFSGIKILRLLLLLNIIPVFKIFNSIFFRQKILLINVYIFVLIVILISTLVVFSVEGETNDKINNLWDALYYVIICVTTIGFGDITPNTDAGRIITIIIALTGITIFTIPSGIIAGTFMLEIQARYKEKKQDKTWKGVSFLEKSIISVNNKIKNKKTSYYIQTEIKIKISGINDEHNLLSNIINFLGTMENILEISKFEPTYSYIFTIKNKNLINDKLYDLIETLDYLNLEYV